MRTKCQQIFLSLQHKLLTIFTNFRLMKKPVIDAKTGTFLSRVRKARYFAQNRAFHVSDSLFDQPDGTKHFVYRSY